MSKLQLQKDIRKHGGYILSDGTCNLQHLLPKAYDLLQHYGIRSNLKQAICHCFRFEREFDFTKPGLFMEQYHGHAEVHDDEKASYMWNENVYHLFNEIAPAGYYFGSSEGDGACVGWFKFETEES